ncbi:MAG: DUF4167 domain-containing protein [Pseudomonadota bacterium]
MNNNRNNRRRGRGNRNNQNSGGGNQLNRIDSRARGNAPQLLDKYKKLAQDAQHHGDRVQMEQYLQFADHYFRVIADNKARQEEARAKRNEARNEEREQTGDESDDGPEGENNRRRNNRRSRGRRDDSDNSQAEGQAGVEGEVVEADGAQQDAPPPKRRTRKPRDEDAEAREPRARSRKPRNGKAADEAAEGDGAAIDTAVLPPSIGGEDQPDGDGDSSVEAIG